MIKAFLQYLIHEKNYSKHTVISYQADLLQFCDYLKVEPENFVHENVKPDDVRGWAMYLSESGSSARTVARKISSLKSFWKFLLQRGLTINNPVLKIILPKTKKPLPVFFKNKEIQLVVDDVFSPDRFEDVRDLLIIEMFYTTGIRLSELITICDNDVDVYAGELKVTGKRNKQRIVPLPVPLIEKISHYQHLRKEQLGLDVYPSLFVRNNGMKLYPKLVYNMVHSVMSKVSSLQKLSPHVLRHSFATGLLNGGADINAVKELLGHSSLAATQVYTHTGFGELYNIYKHAHPRAK